MDLSHRAAGRGVQRRAVPFTGMQLRAADAGATLRFEGYASITESPYEMEDWAGQYTEIVRRGAFTKSLAEGADVPFKINHSGITLARTKSGTMRLAEDSTGLHVDADLDPRSPEVQTLQSAMERHDLDEMSFAFRVVRQTWNTDYTQRDIHEVNLNRGDVSIVNYGANPSTSAHLRARDVATALRELRAGQTLTPDAVETLGQVLQLIAAADGAVDVAQPLLASVLDVPDPNADPDPGASERAGDMELFELRRRLLAL